MKKNSSNKIKIKMYNKRLNNTIQILLILKWNNQLRFQLRITLVLRLVVKHLLKKQSQVDKFCLLSKKIIHKNSPLPPVQTNYNQKAALHKLLAIQNSKKTLTATSQILIAQLNFLILYINQTPRDRS
jgi:hypothetical protein